MKPNFHHRTRAKKANEILKMKLEKAIELDALSIEM